MSPRCRDDKRQRINPGNGDDLCAKADEDRNEGIGDGTDNIVPDSHRNRFFRPPEQTQHNDQHSTGKCRADPVEAPMLNSPENGSVII